MLIILKVLINTHSPQHYLCVCVCLFFDRVDISPVPLSYLVGHFGTGWHNLILFKTFISWKYEFNSGKKIMNLTKTGCLYDIF